MTTHGPSDREPVYLGLGSNLDGPWGGRQANLRLSLDRLAQLKGVQIKAVSSLYETRPLGPQDQGFFLNAAAELRVARQPEEFLEALLAIEADLGRVRKRHWGPRVIDLDLLLWGQRVMATKRLTIPHPEMANREFVLAPLAEIAPQAVHPVLSLTVAQLKEAVPPQGVRLLTEGKNV